MLIDCKNSNSLVQGRYNVENVKKWGKKVPGKDIFKLKNLFISINTNNTHWTLVVIYFEENWIKYYDSIANNTGNSQLNNILQFLMDSDKERKYTRDDFKWDLVVSTASVPRQ